MYESESNIYTKKKKQLLAFYLNQILLREIWKIYKKMNHPVYSKKPIGMISQLRHNLAFK